ncbi:catalase [Sphingobium sp.]|uniref:catalase n=1 Tax=Sphingobium sp. TaxID=1912891 RepID=UPI002CDAD947|nr:catalase [Sphingobium sp.]HUD93363.1 catalase [Sphingobium sp.]
MAAKIHESKIGKDRGASSQTGTFETKTGAGGEWHQIAGDQDAVLTSQQGVAIADDQNSLRAGERGPTLLDDFHLREKLFHFDHERIPERVVHARGFGVHGNFVLNDSLEDFTTARILTEVGETTPMFVRFSTVAGNKGSFDLARDVRGFAVKFYTKEGNWDIVGNNIPVFFIQDAIKFPDLVHAAKQEPDRGFPQAQTAHDNFWDFITLTPESMHMIMWTMSDRAIPRSFRFMEGFGVHSFRLIDKDGKGTFVKFHFKPRQGLQSVLWNEAVKINGADPDFHRRDLWDAIDLGSPPQWDLGVQIFGEDFADQFEFDVLDPTKIIPEEQVPVRIIGTFTLDGHVDNFFAETEQVAFCTQNVVPGIGFSNDPLLQGRNFSYLDTQLKRLGSPNFTHIPINAPRGCPVHNFQQDGHMAMRNPKGRVNYEPNSWANGDNNPRQSPETGYRHFAAGEAGPKIQIRSPSFADHYSQARQFFISQTPIEQKHIGDALVFELSKCERIDIRQRMVAHLRNIDEILATVVAGGLGLPELPDPAPAALTPRTDLPASDALSILKNGPDSFRGRKLGVLVSDGAPAVLVQTLIDRVEKLGAVYEIIAPRIGGALLDNGNMVEGKQKIDGGPSVLYDAVALILSPDGAAELAEDKTAKDFVNDAYAHCKFIAYVDDALPLIDRAGIREEDMDEGLVRLERPDDVDPFLTLCGQLRVWEREFRIDLDAAGFLAAQKEGKAAQ